MRRIHLILTATTLACSPAVASEKLNYGPPPAWVVPQAMPADVSKSAKETPVAILLHNEQIRLEPGKVTTFSEGALKIQTSQGLAAGNVMFAWQPATQTVTVNKIHVMRGGKVTDVLASGQTFTIARRETNMEAATLDGTLTANIQPEGLQVGDTILVAVTVEDADPVMKGHVEATYGKWNGAPMERAQSLVSWPSTVKINSRETPNLPKPRRSQSDGFTILELSQDNIEPLLLPGSAPLRFQVGRLGEVSDFQSWSQVSDLMRPLYKEATTITATGPLRNELEAIRKASQDPKQRAQLALKLVQQRIRYVALLMGDGGYVPASAETTWSRRYGDCKAKTALLLALLRELGVDAEPVLVSSKLGNMLPERLPMVSYFDHVIVRAHIGGTDYWLDGTRTGDGALDRIQVPAFEWGLPLVADATLVPITPKALAEPSMETNISIDASNGIYTPAPFEAERIFRGDGAISLNALYAAATVGQAEQAARQYWRSLFNYVDIESVTSRFDEDRVEFRMQMKGKAKLEWDDGWFYVPASAVGFEADFERTAGAFQDAPIAISFPTWEASHVTMNLPRDFAVAQKKLPQAIKETLAGIEYQREVRLDGTTLVLVQNERSVGREVPYAQALADQPRLRALSNEDVYLKVPTGYRATNTDLQAKTEENPSSAKAFVDRGVIFLDERKYDEAIADFTEAHKLDPKDVWALANRGVAHVWKRDFEAAERDLAAAEAIQADHKIMLRARGLMAELKGDFAGALRVYDTLLDRDSDDSWVRGRRAFIRLQQGRRDEALRDLDLVISKHPHNSNALARRAYILAAKEDWAAAEKDVAAALAADPTNSGAIATKAMIAMEQRDYKTALDLASEALKYDSNDAFALSLQARLLKRERGEEGAPRAYDAAIASDPADTVALLGRAYAYIDARNFDAAEKDIAAVLAIKPADPRALQVRGTLAMRRDDYKAAVAALTSALAAFPGNGPALVQRAEAYRQLGEYDAALADTDAALKAGLVSPSIRLLRVNILMQQGNAAAAGAETDRLVEENPKSEFAMVAAGKAYSAMGIKQKAMESIDRALALNPVAYIYVNRSQVRPFADLEGKLGDLDAALKVDPQSGEALTQKGWLLSKAGRHAEAIELYDRAIKSSLEAEDLQLGRAIVLERAGRAAEARDAFEAERARAKTAGDFNRLCWRMAVNDVALQSAVADCRSALSLDPDHRSAPESLGMALLKVGDLKEALAAYDKAVGKTSSAGAFMGRAIVRARLGDLDGARADAAKARKLRPDIDDTFAEYGLKTETELSLAGR